ncbi:hypothetical protein I3I58_002723, partial [Salmonella enterica subsp. enterica serovar Cerro]|nr:hypothetical protein [Salmonella enterica subsp. enterica]EGT0823084.1 hypothetical protein [Salmonella enterica subsp. enterica serovar Cerro]
YLDSKYGTSDFSIAKEYFNENIEYFINKKIGIDRVYNSLFNIGSSYLAFRYMIGNYPQAFQNEHDEKAAFIAFNEPFVNSVILNFCILQELIEFKMKVLSTSPEFKPHLTYINKLYKRIKKSGAISIRNGWTAHPFKDENKGHVFKPQEIHKETFKVFENLCLEDDKVEYNSCTNDRLAWFCQKYIVHCTESYPSVMEAVHSVLTNTQPPVSRIVAKPREILIEMNKFSSMLRDAKLFGIEPFFHPSEKDIQNIKENGLSSEVNI